MSACEIREQARHDYDRWKRTQRRSHYVGTFRLYTPQGRPTSKVVHIEAAAVKQGGHGTMTIDGQDEPARPIIRAILDQLLRRES